MWLKWFVFEWSSWSNPSFFLWWNLGTFHYFVIIRDLWYYISIGHQPETSLISQHNNFTIGWIFSQKSILILHLYFLEIFFSIWSFLFYECFLQLKEYKSDPDRQKLIMILCWFTCFVQVVNLKLFCQFYESKQKQFHAGNSYKTCKSTMSLLSYFGIIE